MHQIKAAVFSQTGKQRLGKGFSPDELKEAGLTNADARNLAVPVDRKRRTSHEENIATLKARMEKATKKAPSKAASAKKEKKPKN